MQRIFDKGILYGLNNNLGGLSFYEDATGKYVVGADSVPKKLGSGGIVIPSLVLSVVNHVYDAAQLTATNVMTFDVSNYSILTIGNISADYGTRTSVVITGTSATETKTLFSGKTGANLSYDITAYDQINFTIPAWNNASHDVTASRTIKNIVIK